MNDHNAVIGEAFLDDPAAQITRGFLWRDGTTTRIGDPTRAFTWKGGTWVQLDVGPSEASHVNALGQVAGVAGIHPNRRARLWDTSRCFAAPPGSSPDPGSSSGGSSSGGGSSGGSSSGGGSSGGAGGSSGKTW